MTLRIVVVNLVWAVDVRSVDELLDRYRTLTGWAESVAACRVVQRWTQTDHRERRGIEYRFVGGAGAGAVVRAITEASPHIVHVNGVLTPAWVRAIRAGLGPATPIVVQDHGGWHPDEASVWARWRVRGGLTCANGVLVASPGQAELWRRRHVVPAVVPIFDVMEGSTHFAPQPRTTARHVTGLAGDPAILHVGRLITAKDPLTVLEGFGQCVAARPGAHLTVLGPGGPLEFTLRQRCAADPRLRTRTTVIGALPYADLEAFYSAADIVVSGSRREGSGYTVLEAMACGAIPVLSDIPPFDAMTRGGDVGERWAAGDAEACGAALLRAAARGADERQRVRARFVEALSWPAIGRRACEIYREVCDR